MERQALRGTLAALLAALLAGCLGGQTGQPKSRHCGTVTLSASAEWAGTTVGAAAAVFVAPYEAPLLWQVEPRSASTHTAVNLEDSLQLNVDYDGASATRDCEGNLRLPVTVTLATSQSGLAESGAATLELSEPTGALSGNLSYQSKRVVLHATLAESAAGVTLAGGLESLADGLPGASASFDVEP